MAAYILLGYLSGSVLYARLFAKMLGRSEAMMHSKDGNPGAANAFQFGGFWCGLLTLACDLLKGFLPVHMMVTAQNEGCGSLGLTALALAAPVFGHAFPIFYRFQGGKGIAVTFGCLLGLFPEWKPVGILAFFFIFFSVVVRISPHLYRTMVVYACSVLYMMFGNLKKVSVLGFAMITMVVMIRLCWSPEQRERIRVNFLWMH